MVSENGRIIVIWFQRMDVLVKWNIAYENIIGRKELQVLGGGRLRVESGQETTIGRNNQRWKRLIQIRRPAAYSVDPG